MAARPSRSSVSTALGEIFFSRTLRHNPAIRSFGREKYVTSIANRESRQLMVKTFGSTVMVPKPSANASVTLPFSFRNVRNPVSGVR